MFTCPLGQYPHGRVADADAGDRFGKDRTIVTTVWWLPPFSPCGSVLDPEIHAPRGVNPWEPVDEVPRSGAGSCIVLEASKATGIGGPFREMQFGVKRPERTPAVRR
jgi:hypothetical protein